MTIGQDSAASKLNDQRWDLLRQRRALRAAGQDPDKAQVRPAGIVQKYVQ